MSGRMCDIAIIGGGLAGGLTALALRQQRPEITVRLIEAGEKLGGNHRWSWFGSDLSKAGENLLRGVRKVSWDSGNHVAFPEYRRHLQAPYFSMASADFDAAIRRELPEESVILRRTVTDIEPSQLTLSDGQEISARCILDARGLSGSEHLYGGWQVFMGRVLKTDIAHGIARPIIMDARVEQLGGYRFVYVLPLSSHEIFIEDTYYQDTPDLDRSALSSRLDQYCRKHGWDGQITGSETGVLPVITGGNFRNFQAEQRLEGVGVIGARGGFTHPLTSYTMPFAVEVALAIAADADLPAEQMSARLEAMARNHWNATGFYRLLGNMLFGAAADEERYKIFQRFYRLKENLIENFYAGRSTMANKGRILMGKPPVPLLAAIKALSTNRPPLLVDHKGDIA